MRSAGHKSRTTQANLEKKRGSNNFRSGSSRRWNCGVIRGLRQITVAHVGVDRFGKVRREASTNEYASTEYLVSDTNSNGIKQIFIINTRFMEMCSTPKVRNTYQKYSTSTLQTDGTDWIIISENCMRSVESHSHNLLFHSLII